MTTDALPLPLTNPVVIADLHLSDDRPATTAGFLRFLSNITPRFSELVILGDLFDGWLGDISMETDLAQSVAAECRLLTSSGRRVLVMPGDCDFLLGPEFFDASGAEKLPDVWATTVRGNPVLFSHGDRWCTRSATHQVWRTLTDDTTWRAQVRSAPITRRQGMLLEARDEAMLATDLPFEDAKSMTIDEAAVLAQARQAQTQTVIHAHIQQPGVRLTGPLTRWVVPDWYLDQDKKRSGCITFMDDGRPQILY